MTAAVSVELIKDYFRACVSRDPARIAACLDDDVVWSVTGPIDLIPFCGQRHGKSAVIDAIVRVGSSVFRNQTMEPDEVLIDGDRAATFMRIRAIHCSTGRSVSYRGAQFLRFRNGKLVEFRGLMDSFDAAEQVLGHPIDVAAAQHPECANVFAV